MAEGAAFERRPIAGAYDLVGCERPRALGTDEHEVGKASLAQVASVAEAEEVGGMVAHQGNNLFVSQYALRGKVQHHGQRELYHRNAACGLECSALLFAETMGRVVGSDGIDTSVGQGFAKFIAVFAM